MRLQELFESPQMGMAKKAWSELPLEAKDAIEDWERSSSGYAISRQDGTRDWRLPELEEHFLANDEVAQSIERVFAPIRTSLPPVIRLYRGLMPGSPYNPDRVLESWTDTEKDAEMFAGRRSLLSINGERYPSLLQREITDQEIATALATYAKLGYVKFRGKAYVRDKQYPGSYNIYTVASLDNRSVRNVSPETIQKYKDTGRSFDFAGRNHSHLTDGDNLERELKSRQADIVQHNKKILERGEIVTRDTPREKIIWITNNLGSKEYIVQK